MIDAYVAVWSPVLLWSTVVILPVKGATPAFLMAILSFAVIAFDGVNRRYYRDLAALVVVLLVYYLLAKAVQGIEGVRLAGDLTYVSPEVIDVTLRASHLTQSLYLLPGVLAFFFVRERFHPGWDRYLAVAACSLALYGLYEFFHFLIFGTPGDFLGNRSFGQGVTDVIAMQPITIGGVAMGRLKSLTNEPSMYAFTVLPFFVYFYFQRNLPVAGLLGLTLLLSTSTTALVGLAVFFIMRIIEDAAFRRSYSSLIYFLVASILAAGVVVILFPEPAMEVLRFSLDKFEGNNTSGIERSASFSQHWGYWAALPPGQMLLGIGFGTVRSTDMATTLLVNVGLVGALAFTVLVLWPVFRLPPTPRGLGLRHALVQIYVAAMISVPEFSYLSMWVILGMAYNQLGTRACESSSNSLR